MPQFFQCAIIPRYEVLVDTDRSRTNFQRGRRRLSASSGALPPAANIVLDDVVDDSKLIVPETTTTESVFDRYVVMQYVDKTSNY